MNVPAQIPAVGLARPFIGFTSADFIEMMESGAFGDMRVELVEGGLQKMAPAYGGHGQANVSIAAKLITAFVGRNVSIAADLAVRIDEATIRGIDIAVGLDPFPARAAAQANTVWLAVEIADTTLERDLGAKASDYARGGIPNYWVVDLVGSAVHVMSAPGEDGYATRTIIRFGEDLAVPGTDAVIVVA